MTPYAPQTHLETHDVTNAPPPFAARNLYAADAALREAARQRGGVWVEEPLLALGAAARLGGGHAMGRGREPLSARASSLRPFRQAHRRGQVPSGLSPAHGLGDGAPHSQHRLGGGAPRPPRGPRGHAGALNPSRGGHDVPHEHDLCERARFAASAGCSRHVGAKNRGRRL